MWKLCSLECKSLLSILPFLNMLHLCHRSQSPLHPAPSRTGVHAVENISLSFEKPSITENFTYFSSKTRELFFLSFFTCTAAERFDCSSAFPATSNSQTSNTTLRPAGPKAHQSSNHAGKSLSLSMQSFTHLFCCSLWANAGSEPKSWAFYQSQWGSKETTLYQADPPGWGPLYPGTWGMVAAHTELERLNIRLS